MVGQEGIQELIALFDPAGTQTDLEMTFAQFNALLAQQETLKSHAASTVKAAYAQVGAGLSLQALVLFQFRVNEEGCVDPAFNLPLEYMAANAGVGPDLGVGPISMACRGQCPVPWHAINLWEPVGDGESHPAFRVQKAVWRNRLGLKPLQVRRVANGSVAIAAPTAAGRRPLDAVMELDEALRGGAGLTQHQAMEDKLTATFGEAGRVSVRQYTRQHREQVNQVTAHFRAEMQRQQQGYLDQVKNCREEIQKLKAALRNEQERNRRLHQLLRG